MPTATRELHYANTKLPKIHTVHPMSATMPSPSPVSARNQTSTLLGQSRELPMPVVSRITSITQAQATLQHCATRLNKSWQGNPARASPPSSPIDGTEKRLFQQWLEKWEQAFTAYLSVYMSSMKADDVTRSRVLKANHLSCTVLASEADTGLGAFDMFESEFQAIVELANAVVVSRHRSIGSPITVTTVTATSTLDVREPLYVVVACCDRLAIRNKAVELLSKINIARGALSMDQHYHATSLRNVDSAHGRMLPNEGCFRQQQPICRPVDGSVVQVWGSGP